MVDQVRYRHTRHHLGPHYHCILVKIKLCIVVRRIHPFFGIEVNFLLNKKFSICQVHKPDFRLVCQKYLHAILVSSMILKGESDVP